MPLETFIEKQEESISIHVFSVSAAMVGVCLTAIGIINVVTVLHKVQTWADEIATVDALVFLGACFISYVAIKTKDRKHRLAFEKTADYLFLIGLVIAVMTCAFIVMTLN
jgi:hypothetical protein